MNLKEYASRVYNFGGPVDVSVFEFPPYYSLNHAEEGGKRQIFAFHLNYPKLADRGESDIQEYYGATDGPFVQICITFNEVSNSGEIQFVDHTYRFIKLETFLKLVKMCGNGKYNFRWKYGSVR